MQTRRAVFDYSFPPAKPRIESVLLGNNVSKIFLVPSTHSLFEGGDGTKDVARILSTSADKVGKIWVS